MSHKKFFKKFTEYDSTKPQIVKEIAGLLGIPINGSLTVEVPNRNGFVYVRLRNNTNELIQAFNEKVSPVYGLPVLVKWNLNRYEIISRDTNRYQDWGSFSSFLPRHGSQHSLNFEDGQGGDVTWIYSRQVMPFATVPSGTEGAGTVFVMPHVYRNPTDASWNYIGDESSANFLPAKPTGTSARMMLLVWNLETGDPLIITGSFLSENLTGTSSVISSVPTVTNQNYVPLAAIRLVSGTQSILWDNIYDMRQWAITTPPSFQGGFAVWDEGIPQGTGTVLDFVGDNVQASVSGSVVRVYVTGSAGGSTVFSGVDQIGIFGQDEGINQGTGTILNVTGQRATLSRSGTVLNLNISPDPAELIGIMGWDDGTPKGTGTIIDFGNNLTASLSGTVLRIDASGGSANPPITGSVVIQDDEANQGSALVLNFGSNLTASVSGNIAQIDVTNVPAPVNTDGVVVWDEGVPIGTGSVFNFVGSNVDASISGSVVRVFVTGSTGGGTSIFEQIWEYAAANNSDPVDTLIQSGNYRVFVFMGSHNALGWKAATNATYDIPAGKKLVVTHFVPATALPIDSANRKARFVTSGGTEIIADSQMRYGGFYWAGDLTTPSKLAEITGTNTVRLEIWNSTGDKRAMGAYLIAVEQNA